MKILRDIKIIVFDVDGILVKRGTKIKQKGNIMYLELKKINKKQINQIKKLNKIGYKINISSGRSLPYLQNMFREILPYTSITYENGSCTLYNGIIHQHTNSFQNLHEVNKKLLRIKDKNIKGFEPKEFIITIHCKKRIKKIERLLKKYPRLYCLWNGEAYDIGIKKIQTKANGIKKIKEIFKLKKKNVLAIGDNYNDKEMLNEAGIKITADKDRVNGDFYIPLNSNKLPADILMEEIIRKQK